MNKTYIQGGGTKIKYEMPKNTSIITKLASHTFS